MQKIGLLLCWALVCSVLGSGTLTREYVDVVGEINMQNTNQLVLV